MGREGACNHQVCYRVGLTVRIASERLTVRRAGLTVRRVITVLALSQRKSSEFESNSELFAIEL